MPGAPASSLGSRFCRAEETVAPFPLCTVSRGSGAHLAPDEEGRRRVHGRFPHPQRESVPAACHLGNAIGAWSHRRGEARSPGRGALTTTHAHTNRLPALRRRAGGRSNSRENADLFSHSGRLRRHTKRPREAFRR